MGFYKEIQWTVGYPFTLFSFCYLFVFLLFSFLFVIYCFLHRSCYLGLPYAYFKTLIFGISFPFHYCLQKSFQAFYHVTVGCIKITRIPWVCHIAATSCESQ